MEALFPWIGVIVLFLVFLTLDLGVFHRVPHAITTREAFIMSCVWIALSLLFNVYVWDLKGSEAALAFFTGYLIEKLLSLDNMFIFLAIFQYFSIPLRHQHRVLFWGILGAIIFRLIFILIGIKLIERFEWVLYFFGALLVYSSYKMYRDRNRSEKFKTNKIIAWLQKWIPLKENYKGGAFFLKENGKWLSTPLFLALLTIEITDVIFAIDSIPAIFAITLDPFVVFTSNIFAILGLRSLYFLLVNIITRFYYLQHALSFILGFVGVKLILANTVHIPLGFSISVIAFALGLAVLASLWKDKKDENKN